jgi:hypothetical protein
VLLPYWQEGPAKPVLQTHVPLVWATPRPEQVMALLNWHRAPANPGEQEQAPMSVQVPLPLQVVDAWQKVQDGYP